MDYYGPMRFKLAVYVCLLCLLGSSLGLRAVASTPESAHRASALDADLFYQLLLGELNLRAEDPGAAFSLVLDVARKTGDASLYRRALEIAVRARAGDSALEAARAWGSAQPASADAQHFTVQVLLGLNRPADAQEALAREIALTPLANRPALLWSLPGRFERVGDRALAARTVQRVLGDALSQAPLAATAWAVVGRMWLLAEDRAAALGAARKAMAADAKSEHAGLLALALWDSDAVAAEALLRQHLPHAQPDLHLGLVRALVNAQRHSDARAELAALKNRAPGYAQAWLVEGALALQDKQLDSAQLSLQRFLDLVTQAAAPGAELLRGRSQALMSLAQIAQMRNQPAQAQAWLQQVDHPPDVLAAQIARAQLLARQQGQLEAALTLIQSQVAQSEAQERLKQSAEIQLLRDHKQYDRARQRLTQALAATPADTDLVYELAMVNEKLGQLDEMERLLRQLIQIEPNNPHPYNALGYSFAERGVRLSEARQLIVKALELSPGNPFITDSLAWVEFRAGNHEEALRLLREAYQARPDAEIAAHLGEVLWVKGERERALGMFREAQGLSPDNETLRETLQRLRISL